MTAAAPGPSPTIYTTRAPCGLGPGPPGTERSEAVRRAPPARALAPARRHPGAVRAARRRRRRPGPGRCQTRPPSSPRRAAGSHASRLQGPRTAGDSNQESGGGGASQGPEGLAPALPARACQGAPGLPLPTASPTARRTGSSSTPSPAHWAPLASRATE
ncbi:BBSome-interacting protein 1 isoform X1 [Symphalangus syndactylus]|uniref:BBSome-interacting protein 1 isoform X1 n=1 Tax=Symphalangus syndactylus TaxID=9590 RepID=UPI003005183B